MGYQEKKIEELENQYKKNKKAVLIMGGMCFVIALAGAIIGKTTIFGIFAGLLALIPYSKWEENKKIKEELAGLY